MKTVTTSTSGARKCTDGVRAERNNVFLGERLDAVGDRLEKAERAHAVRANPVLDAAQAFALEDRGEREEAGKDADDGDDAEQHARSRLQRGGQKADEPIAQEDEDLVEIREEGVRGHRASLLLPAGGAAAAGAGCCGFGSGCIGRGFGLGFGFGFFLGQARVHFGGFGRMNRVIVLVRLGQLLAVEKQAAEAIVGGQLKFGVHLDGFKRADFNADLAAHADGNIDVEARGIKLRLAHVIRLLVLALLDVDALGRALFLADLAGHAAQAGLPVGAVVDQKGKDARVLGGGNPLLRILHRRQPLLGDVSCRQKFLAVSAIPFRIPSPSNAILR